jgi:hypothetical protein
MVAAVQRNLEDSCHAMLWLVTYSFLLRLPSEVSFLGLLLSISHAITLLMPGTSLVQVRT